MRPKLSRYKYIRRFDDEHPTPALANTNDGPSKDILLTNGWAEREIPQKQIYDLFFDPNEAHNLPENPQHAGVLEEMRGRLENWMHGTKDPILDGPVPAPRGPS